jgi:hypothetical protein
MTGSRTPLESAREVLDELGRGGPRVVTFARGLAIGALVGAAIAGTALLERRSRGGKDPDIRSEASPPDADDPRDP